MIQEGEKRSEKAQNMQRSWGGSARREASSSSSSSCSSSLYSRFTPDNNNNNNNMDSEQHLPTYDPLSQVAQRERLRLRSAQKAVHLIPLLVLLCALILWFFSSSHHN